MIGFTGRRLFRALVSLLLFQIILFSIIQALPSNNAGLSQSQMMQQVAASRPEAGRSSADASREETAPASGGSVTVVDEQLMADAAFFEELGLLDDAAMLRAEAVKEVPAPQTEPELVSEVVPAPEVIESQVVDSELMADVAMLEELGLLDDAAMVKEAAVLENPSLIQEGVDASVLEASGLPGDSATSGEIASIESDSASESTTNYAEGLAALRPPNESVAAQFFVWMSSFFRGDLGESTEEFGVPVTEILATKLPRTLLLFLPSVIAGFLLGLWLGKRVAWQRRGWVDTSASLGGAALYTSFPPWLAFLAITIFAVNFRWFPVEKLINPIIWLGIDLTLNQLLVRILLTAVVFAIAMFALFRFTRKLWYRTLARVIGGVLITVLVLAPWAVSELGPLALDVLAHLALPMFTLVLLSFGETMLIMRTTMQETKGADHIPLARATGLSDAEVRDKHVARVAMLPVLTRFIVYLPFVIVGAFAIEQYFGWDGMGQRLVQAANQSDLPVLMGILSVVGIGILVAHIILDVITARLDPRLRNLAPSGSEGAAVGDDQASNAEAM